MNNRNCIPFKLFYAAVKKAHSHGHIHKETQIQSKLLVNFFISHTFLCFFSIFTYDCPECKKYKYITIKNTLLCFSYFERTPLISITESIDTKCSFSTPPNGNQYVFVIIAAVSYFIVTKPSQYNNSKMRINSVKPLDCFIRIFSIYQHRLRIRNCNSIMALLWLSFQPCAFPSHSLLTMDKWSC